MSAAGGRDKCAEDMTPDVRLFPKYKYHAELDPVVVADDRAEKALGEGWKDSPAGHGVITNPSKEQALKMRMDALAKDSGKKEEAKKDDSSK